MPRRLFNKQRLQRKMRQSSVYYLMKSRDEMPKSEKDFAWKTKKRNPFQSHYDKKETGRFKLKIFFLLLCILTIFWISMYHSFFCIKNIYITGTQRIQSQDIHDAVQGLINHKKWLILPCDNYFLVDLEEIKEVLLTRFPLLSLSMEKKFPNYLKIAVEEKISTIIYDNGEEYSYLGVDGKVVEIIRKVGESEWKIKKETVTSTDEFGDLIIHEEEIERTHIVNVKNAIIEMGDYPIVYDARNRGVGLQETALKEKTVASIIKWFNLLQNQANVSFGYLEIENELGDAILYTREGWYALVRLDDVERQFVDLKFMLDNKIKDNPFNYLDVRYEGRVYWQ